MNRKYFWWQLKQWLPMFFIILAVVVSSYLLDRISATPFRIVYDYGGVEYPSSGLTVLMVTALLSTYVMPFFVFSFRYGKQGADTFLPLPVKRNEIRRTRLLIGLIFIEAAMTVSFILGILLFLAKQIGFHPEAAYGEYRYIINYGYVVIAFLMMSVVVGGNYFLNCYFMSLGRNVLDAILLLLAGNLLVSFSFITLIVNASYILGAFGAILASEALIDWITCIGDFGPIFGAAYSSLLFEDLIVFGEYNQSSIYALTSPMVIVCLIGYLLLIAWSVYSTLFRDDPSGEYFGLTGSHLRRVDAIPHVFFFLVGLYVAMLLSMSQTIFLFALFFFVYILYTVFYYGVLALFSRSFNIGKLHLICFISISAFVAMLALVEGIGLNL